MGSISDSLSGPRARISLAALNHNLAAVRRFAPSSRVLAVVKANAYGHGLVAAARALAAADAFGVARLEEGLALRAAGIPNPIVLLEGVMDVSALAAAAQANLELVVHTLAQVTLLETWRGAHRFNVWVKIDTGMHRLGLSAEEFVAAWNRLRRCTAAIADIRVMSHLAVADERANPQTAVQLQRFDELTAGLNVERSVANSAALIAFPHSRLEWVRPGILLYGISPFAGEAGEQLGLQPAMTLQTGLIAIHEIAAGEAVGYGARWRAPIRTRIGVAAIGYGDGYPRQVRNGAPLKVGAAAATLAGRVSMDMIGMDLTAAPHVRIGDAVTLWGPGVPVEKIAEYADTIPYELVCGISQRVSVEYSA